jgi:hypothetical protein
VSTHLPCKRALEPDAEADRGKFHRSSKEKRSLWNGAARNRTIETDPNTDPAERIIQTTAEPVLDIA